MRDIAILATMARGRPQVIAGIRVERLNKDLYRVNGESVLSLMQVSQQIKAAQMTPSIKIPDAPIFPEDVRAMTTHFPWAWLMGNGYKGEEYRHRRIAFPPIVFFHSGLSTESDWAIQEYGIPRSEIKRGYILGAGRVIDCQPSKEDPQRWAYHMDDQVFFDKPAGPISGKQAIFWKATDTQSVRVFNQAWMQWEAMQ